MTDRELLPAISEDVLVTINTNTIRLDSWIELRERADGDYDLIGMGRLTEISSKTGAVIRDSTEPTGLTGWAPREFVAPRRKPLFWKLFGLQ